MQLLYVLWTTGRFQYRRYRYVYGRRLSLKPVPLLRPRAGVPWAFALSRREYPGSKPEGPWVVPHIDDSEELPQQNRENDHRRASRRDTALCIHYHRFRLKGSRFAQILLRCLCGYLRSSILDLSQVKEVRVLQAVFLRRRVKTRVGA